MNSKHQIICGCYFSLIIKLSGNGPIVFYGDDVFFSVWCIFMNDYSKKFGNKDLQISGRIGHKNLT